MASPSPLLRLSAELRNCIYREVLVESKPINLIGQDGSPLWLSPPLLQTCRQIRQEALSMYYHDNIFLLKPGTPMARKEPLLISWLRSIGSEQVAVLRRILVDPQYSFFVVGDAQALLAGLYRTLAKAKIAVRDGAIAIGFRLLWTDQMLWITSCRPQVNPGRSNR